VSGLDGKILATSMTNWPPAQPLLMVGVARVHTEEEDPNTKIQDPKKLQTPKIQMSLVDQSAFICFGGVSRKMVHSVP
jgi:hypothetical protein